MSKARQLMNKGCVAYLAMIVEVLTAAMGLEDIPIVRAFSEMFPPWFTIVPSDMEIELMIDLVPENIPISKTPYRMTLIELRAVKAQLQDLMERRFVRPSISP